MANDKRNVNKLTAKNKESVAGGSIYYAEGRYYVPEPDGPEGRYWKILDKQHAIAHEQNAGRNWNICKYKTKKDAQDAATDEAYDIITASPVASGWADWNYEDDIS